MAENIIMKKEQPIILDEDAEMVYAAQKNPAAFKHLYNKWLKPVYRYFYFRVGNTKDAEDLTSQVFLKAFESISRYKDRGNFSAWLFSIAHAKTVDHYRKPCREVPIDRIEKVDSIPDPLILATDNDEIRRVVHLLKNCTE